MIRRMVLEQDGHVVGLARFEPVNHPRMVASLERMGFDDGFDWRRSKRRFERRRDRGHQRCFVLTRANVPLALVRYHDGDGCAHLTAYFVKLGFDQVDPREFAIWRARFQVEALALAAEPEAEAV